MRGTAVAGVVALDPATTPARLLTASRRSYHVVGDRHHHVHGAPPTGQPDLLAAAPAAA